MVITAVVTAFAKFVAALGGAVMAYRKWREESEKARKLKEEQQRKEES